ncbi:MAG TPA: GYD domain-containing protein [Dehalococcoidia bacterium]|nr:GYD domain-containing protein [Dehalococcoidia bacterium]
MTSARGEIMGTFVVFTTLTPQGRKNLHADPDRLRIVTRQAEKLGAKVLQQYATIGQYDFVTVIDAPDNAAVQGIGAEISGLGTVRLTTFPAIKMDRFQQLLKLEPYRTEPHQWQTSFWARAARRIGRHWVTDRHVSKYCKPLTIEGRENLKGHKGAAIVIANHSSHFDSPVVLSALPERIRGKVLLAAAADKFYAYRRKRHWFYSLFHSTFPVHRGGGIKQLDYPMSLLRRGWSIIIYPEGGRSKTGQIQRFKAGPAIMAMQGKVQVIPIYIEGLREVMPKGQRDPRPGPVFARIGKPVSLDGVTSVSEATAMLENAMRELAGLPPHRASAPAPAAAAPAAAPAQAGGGGS